MVYQYIRVENRADELVIYFLCKDLVTDTEVEGVARELHDVCKVAAAESKNLVLDLGGVQALYSSMLGKLITLNKRAKRDGLTFRIRNMSPDVAEIFRAISPAIVSLGHDVSRGDINRFAPELFQNRREVFRALKSAGFDWMVHFKTVDLLHDLYGVEVCGIKHERDARSILELLSEMHPSWHQMQPWYKGGPDWGWQAAVHRDVDPRTGT